MIYININTYKLAIGFSEIKKVNNNRTINNKPIAKTSQVSLASLKMRFNNMQHPSRKLCVNMGGKAVNSMSFICWKMLLT